MAQRSELRNNLHRPEPIAWKASAMSVDYPEALTAMDQRVAAIAAGVAKEQLWLLEHPPLYTAGTSANPADLVDPARFPVFSAGRGGQYTYHGPGQRVAYVMLNLARRGGDVRAFVATLEDWLIATLGDFGILGERREDRVGIWVRQGSNENKIAAIGIRVRRGITFHGVSLNLAPDLAHFDGIIPCGISEHGVTSLKALGIEASMSDLDSALLKHFVQRFGPLVAD